VPESNLPTLTETNGKESLPRIAEVSFTPAGELKAAVITIDSPGLKVVSLSEIERNAIEVSSGALEVGFGCGIMMPLFQTSFLFDLMQVYFFPE
jgi:hypothetical protein